MGKDQVVGCQMQCSNVGRLPLLELDCIHLEQRQKAGGGEGNAVQSNSKQSQEAVVLVVEPSPQRDRVLILDASRLEVFGFGAGWLPLQS